MTTTYKTGVPLRIPTNWRIASPPQISNFHLNLLAEQISDLESCLFFVDSDACPNSVRNKARRFISRLRSTDGYEKMIVGDLRSGGDCGCE